MDRPCLRHLGMKQPTPQPHTPATVQITTLEIAGMSCDGCARQVTAALNALEGVVHASVDLQKHHAIVDHLAVYSDAARSGDGGAQCWLLGSRRRDS